MWKREKMIEKRKTKVMIAKRQKSSGEMSLSSKKKKIIKLTPEINQI